MLVVSLRVHINFCSFTFVCSSSWCRKRVGAGGGLVPEEVLCRKRVDAGGGLVPEESLCRKRVGAGRG